MSQPHYTAISTQKELATLAQSIASGYFPAVAVIGPGGCGKSTAFEAALPPYRDDPAMRAASNSYWVSGNITPINLYMAFAQNPGKIIVADDCQDMYTNARYHPLLKQIAESRHTKTITWLTLSHELKDRGLDQTTQTTSQFLMIGNNWKTVGSDAHAIETRFVWFRYIPTNEELFRYAETWFEDREILRFVYDQVRKGEVHELDLRLLTHALAFKKSGFLNWKEWLKNRFLTNDPNDDLLEDYQAIVAWLTNHNQKTTFTASDISRALPRFQKQEKRLLDAINVLLIKDLIHELPKPRPSSKGGRPPKSFYGRGPAPSTKLQNPKRARVLASV